MMIDKKRWVIFTQAALASIIDYIDRHDLPILSPVLFRNLSGCFVARVVIANDFSQHLRSAHSEPAI